MQARNVLSMSRSVCLAWKPRRSHGVNLVLTAGTPRHLVVTCTSSSAASYAYVPVPLPPSRSSQYRHALWQWTSEVQPYAFDSPNYGQLVNQGSTGPSRAFQWQLPSFGEYEKKPLTCPSTRPAIPDTSEPTTHLHHHRIVDAWMH